MSINLASPSLSLAHTRVETLETREISIMVSDLLDFPDGTSILAWEKIEDLLPEEEIIFICNPSLVLPKNTKIGSWLVISVAYDTKARTHTALSIVDILDNSIL